MEFYSCPYELKRATSGSACYDLQSTKDIIIKVGESAKVPSGLKLILDKYYYGKIENRSGFSTRNKTIILGGVIDSDYRGECFICMRKSN